MIKLFLTLIVVIVSFTFIFIVEEGKNVVGTSISGNVGFSDGVTYSRPSYLIIGAGKSGTSSLYEYLSHHSKFKSSTTKQVHYFKYSYKKGMNWYLKHFDSDPHFLTGESAPGYLPYPFVAERVFNDLGPTRVIIAIFRNPLTRAHSSYNYNYLPQAKKLKLGGDSIVSFEEFISTELDMLEKCLADDGAAVKLAKESTYMGKNADTPQYNLIEGCYENPSVDVFAETGQWASIVKNNPKKRQTLDSPLKYLFQALIGRGLAALQLSWWLGAFENVYVVCSEDLLEKTEETLTDLSQWLGLPSETNSEWAPISKLGCYNVGDNNPGGYVYDQKISWEEFELTQQKVIDEGDDRYKLSEETEKRFWLLIRAEQRRLNQLRNKFSFGGGNCDWELK